MDGILILQLITGVLAVGGILTEGILDKDSKNKRLKWIARGISITVLVIGTGLVMFGRKSDIENDRLMREQLNGQKEQLLLAKQLEVSQKDQILILKDLSQAEQDSRRQLIEAHEKELQLSEKLVEEQGRGIQQIVRLTLARPLAGIEISFKPSAEQWSKIAQIYQNIKPTDTKQPSYHQAPIIAHRVGDSWRIDFLPVTLTEGMYWFPHLPFDDPNNNAFGEILREACISLLIKWGDGTKTDLEPLRGDYPSVVTVKQDSISFILRPPLLTLNLANLKAHPRISLRGRKTPVVNELSFHSLDPDVYLDQTIHLNWRREPVQDQRERTKPFFSGPHALDIRFKSLSK